MGGLELLKILVESGRLTLYRKGKRTRTKILKKIRSDVTSGYFFSIAFVRLLIVVLSNSGLNDLVGVILYFMILRHVSENLINILLPRVGV